jgi:hypothetical protein
LPWIEQHQPVTREKLPGAFEDMDYEQLQSGLSELQRKRKLFEINPEHTTPPSNRPSIARDTRTQGTGARRNAASERTPALKATPFASGF